MSAPLVSVLMPARNAAPTVEAAARSILHQSLTDLELVAVDDGSTDGTLGLLEGLAAKDARVRVLKANGSGLVAALNAGAARCQGEFLARMDADDLSLPARLEASVKALRERPSLWGVGTGVELIGRGRGVSDNLQAYARWLNGLITPEALFHDRFVESPLCHPAVTLRADRLRQVGLWREGPFPEDYELWLRMIEQGAQLMNLPEVLFQWFDHDGRLTRTDPRYARPAFTTLKADHLARNVLSPGRPFAIWGAGQTGKALRDALAPLGRVPLYFIDVDPKKIGQRPKGFEVISHEAVRRATSPHLLIAVGTKGARAQVREFLGERGFTEGADFTCCA